MNHTSPWRHRNVDRAFPARAAVSGMAVLFLSAVCGAESSSPESRLIEAARRGDAKAVQQLLADGTDVNARGPFQVTALWQAAGKGHFDLVELLVEHGADVNLPDSIWHMTPLMLVNDPETAALLIDHGARGAAEKLYTAALRGDLALVRAVTEAQKPNPKVLAVAKAHADIGEHAEIARFLAEAIPGRTLPRLPAVPATRLATYRGRYVSDRLNEIEMVVRDERLYLRRSGGRAFLLTPVDQHVFVLAGRRYRFETHEGEVKWLVEEGIFSRRPYTRETEALSNESPDVRVAGRGARDAPRVLARGRWPSFRGIDARGLAVDQNLPDGWNVEQGTNVRWRTPIPGLGHACPIVWDDRVFVTTAVSEAGKNDLRIGLYGDVHSVDDTSKHSWRLLCLDRRTGTVLWERVAEEGIPTVKRHLKSTQANSTPVTDGTHVVALFNSGGLYCYDFEGRLLWSRQLGVLDSGPFVDPEQQWGFGSSPIIYRDTVVVQCDIQQESFMATYDLKTGREIWKEPRDEIPSWGSPTVYEGPQGPLLFTNGTNFARAYDVVSGREVWRLSGNAAITVPTPQAAYGLVFVTSGYRPIQPIFAVRLDAAGDLTPREGEPPAEGIAWSKPRGGPYLPTPLVYEGYLYTCSNNGILTCYEAETGRRVYRKRAARGGASSFTASPVAADGRIYLTAESGVVLTVKAGPVFELLGRHSLGEYCLATPAIAGGLLLARTHRHLIAIGQSD